jgi:hypothetical protein
MEIFYKFAAGLDIFWSLIRLPPCMKSDAVDGGVAGAVSAS